MSAKRVSIGARPTTGRAAADADAWVGSQGDGGDDKPERMKRLTIDVPESLHRAIKVACASRGAKIADEVREILLQKYGNV